MSDVQFNITVLYQVLYAVGMSSAIVPTGLLGQLVFAVDIGCSCQCSLCSVKRCEAYFCPHVPVSAL